MKCNLSGFEEIAVIKGCLHHKSTFCHKVALLLICMNRKYYQILVYLAKY